MAELSLGTNWMGPPSPELSRALAMLLHQLFASAPAEFLTQLSGATGPPTNIYEIKKENNPLIGICYDPSLIENRPYFSDESPKVFYLEWTQRTDSRREQYDKDENRRWEESGKRLYPRPFRMRYELYTEPQYAPELLHRLVYPGDQETSIYFRVEDPAAEVGWNWPLRVGFLPGGNSGSLFEELKDYIDNVRDWLGRLVDLVCLDSETDSCDLLLIPESIGGACDAVSQLGFKISADCVLTVGWTTGYQEVPLPIEKFRNQVSTAGVGIVPVDPGSIGDWFSTLIRELSHNEPIDVALFSASVNHGLRPPFLVASRKLIEFSKLTESLKSIGEELLKASPEAASVSVSPEDAEVFGIEPGEYHPRDIGKIFKSGTGNFSFDQERRSGTRSIDLSKFARRSMNKSKKPEGAAPRWIQAAVYDLRDDKAPAKLEKFLYAGERHKLVVRIGVAEDGWLQNSEKFFPKELSDRKTYLLTVIFTEPQLCKQPLVSFLELPPQGNSTECEFTFQVPKDVENIEGRISIVYKNRVLQTAILKANVADDPSEAASDCCIEILPETIVRADLSDLKNRRNFDGAFILDHDASNARGLTAIKDKYVSFSSLSELDELVKKVDEFMTQVADYPADYVGELNTPATVTLLCDLAKYGWVLYGALAEFTHGNMQAIFSGPATENSKGVQRIQIISAKSDTRLPMEFLYDRQAPESSNEKLCPKALDALKQDGCFEDCDGMTDQEHHVCPMGFWGLSKIIERHTYNSLYTGEEVKGDFRFQSEPADGRRRLDIFRSVLLGASDRADKIEVRSPDGKTVAIEAGGIGKLVHVLDAITKTQNQKVTSWKEWCDKISDISPTALLLLTHTEKKGTTPALEIEQGLLVEMQSIGKKYVYSGKEQFPPVVFLIGCETGAADIEIMNFVSQFRRGGAAIIVSTGAPIRGRHAIPVTSELLNQLKQLSDEPETTFGQAMRIVKQNMLAQGFPMVLTLMTYGDADWQIGK